LVLFLVKRIFLLAQQAPKKNIKKTKTDMESLLSSIVSSYINKYVVGGGTNAEIELSLWAGDVVLKNIELRFDVLLEQFGLTEMLDGMSCRIFVREIRLKFPYASLASQPLDVFVSLVEITASSDEKNLGSVVSTGQPNQPLSANKSTATTTNNGGSDNDAATQSGWAPRLIEKIIANARFHVEQIAIKLIERDTELSIFLDNVRAHSSSLATWSPSWILPGAANVLQKSISIESMTVCIDKRWRF
jgi:hypothetical protein